MVLEVGFDSLHFPLRSFWCTEVMLFIFFMVFIPEVLSPNQAPTPAGRRGKGLRDPQEPSEGWPLSFPNPPTTVPWASQREVSRPSKSREKPLKTLPDSALGETLEGEAVVPLGGRAWKEWRVVWVPERSS